MNALSNQNTVLRGWRKGRVKVRGWAFEGVKVTAVQCVTEAICSIWGTPIKMPHTATKSHWMLNSSELSECLGPTMAFHGTRNLHCNYENGSNMIIKCIPKEYADQVSPWVCFWRHGTAPRRLPCARGVRGSNPGWGREKMCAPVNHIVLYIPV